MRRLLRNAAIVLSLVLSLHGTSHATIFQGNISDTNTLGVDMTAVSSLSWTHTVAQGSRRILMLYVSCTDDTGAGIGAASATYNGVAMSLVRTDEGASGGTEPRNDIFQLVNPTVGANTLAVTLNGANKIAVGAAVDFYTVNQQSPMEDANGEGSVDTLGGTVTDTIDTITTDAVYTYVLGSKVTSTPATAGGETEIAKFEISDGTNINSFVAGYKAGGATGTKTVTYTGFGVDDCAISLAAITPGKRNVKVIA